MKKKELEDKDGFEKQYQNSCVGFANIPLANLRISSELEVQVNKQRVNTIMESMDQKYDPSIAIPVVCPEEGQTVIDLNRVKLQKFVVVQKIHTVSAFKEFEKEGKFTKMKSHSNGTVPCYVLRINSAGLILYGNQRANEIQNKFSRKTLPQDLLRTFHSLVCKESCSKSLEGLDRMIKLARIGPNEGISIRKLCSWTATAFTALMQVITQFEQYETMDVKAKGHQGRLSRGEKMSITNVLFKKLGKVDEKYFLSVYRSILDNECSLKYCIEEYDTAKGVEKVSSVLCILSGYKTYESIKQEHPDKFQVEKLKQFIGAEIFKDGQKNLNAQMLEKYYEAAVSVNTEEAVSDNPIRCVEIPNDENDSLLTLKGGEAFDSVDTLIFHMEGEVIREQCWELMTVRSVSGKVFLATLVTFPSEKLQFEALTFLRNQNIADDAFRITPILFHDTSMKELEGIVENVKFGVLFGKFSVHEPPLNMYQSSMSNLLSIVEKISPSYSSVAVISDSKVHLVQVYSSTRQVTFFGYDSEIRKLKIHLQKLQCILEDKVAPVTDDSEDVIPVEVVPAEENLSSTSPFKTCYTPKVASNASCSSTLSFQERLDNLSYDI